jgi:perosamine synthetase
MTTAIVDPTLGLTKERIAHELDAAGIDTRPFFHPLSSLPAYAGTQAAAAGAWRNQIAYALAPWGINLPSALALSDAEVDAVAAVLKRVVARARAIKRAA